MCVGVKCEEYHPRKGDRVYLDGLYKTHLGDLPVMRAARDGTWADVRFGEDEVVRLPTRRSRGHHDLDFIHYRGRPTA